MGDELGQDNLDASVAPETGGGNINPAWNDLLSTVPEDLHSQITPHLSKWDQNFQTEINKVHSRYEPWKEILEGNEPDGVRNALEVLNRINTNPQEVLKALQDFVEAQAPGEQQGQVDVADIPSEFLNHPEFQKLNQMVNTMAQLLVENQQKEQQSKADQELESDIKRLSEEHGEFDVNWVLTKALTYDGDKNVQNPVEQAVLDYKEFVTGILANSRKPAPKVLGQGGTAPNSQVDVKKLSDTERRGFITQLLESAAAAQQ